MEPDEPRKKKSSRRNHGHRKRRTSGGSDEHTRDPHIKVKAMLRSNPSTKTALVKDKQPAARSGHSATESEESEEESPKPKGKGREQTSSEPQPAPFQIPTAEEIRNYEYYVRLKAQAASIQPVMGHVYDGVKVRGNACVVQGNAYDANRPGDRLLARNHQYLNLDADDNSFLWIGDMTHEGLAVFFEQQRNNQKANNRHYGDKKHGTGRR